MRSQQVEDGVKENTDDIISDTKINLKTCLVDSVHVEMMKTMAMVEIRGWVEALV